LPLFTDYDPLPEAAMRVIRFLAILLLLGLAACGSTGGAPVAPWIVGHAGPPFPYNSPWCP
jgi:hypothetical protein